MPQRTVAAVVVVIGGVMLFVSLFVEWYDPGTSGWTAFEILDLVLAFAAVIVLTQLINPPPLVHDAARGTGGFLALAGSLILVAGGVLARRESVTDRRDSDEARRRTMQRRREEGL